MNFIPIRAESKEVNNSVFEVWFAIITRLEEGINGSIN